jgi:hypothetical protein
LGVLRLWRRPNSLDAAAECGPDVAPVAGVVLGELAEQLGDLGGEETALDQRRQVALGWKGREGGVRLRVLLG